MSNPEDDDVEKSARNHMPAIIGIVAMLVAVVIIYMLFPFGSSGQDEGIAVTPPPEDTPLTNAEGLEADSAPAIAAEPAAPAGAATE